MFFEKNDSRILGYMHDFIEENHHFHRPYACCPFILSARPFRRLRFYLP